MKRFSLLFDLYELFAIMSNVVFGRSITRRLNDTYQLAQAHSGIITSLPVEAQGVAPREEQQLKLYLRNARHREMYRDEILALIQHNRSLETLYHQEMGRVHARTYSGRLRDMGLSGVWFAILEGVPIASGTTRQEVEQAVQRIVPQHKWPFLYTFQVHEPAHRQSAQRSKTPCDSRVARHCPLPVVALRGGERAQPAASDRYGTSLDHGVHIGSCLQSRKREPPLRSV